ncbi:MAG: ribonuclease E/G [Clostridia bacterium]|nr:ribonuclease E/G [Clostridia bacterium]
MSKRILVEHRGGQLEAALMEDQRLLFFGREQAGVQAEQIYLATVDRIMKGMEAAFVKIGREQTGFLPFSECPAPPRSGDQLLLQVKKPPIGEKAPYMTADIALAGRYVILTPLCDRKTVSQKIPEGPAREALLALASDIAPAGMGLILRTEACGAPPEALAREAAVLRAQWLDIQEAAASAQAPCLIRQRETLLHRLIRDERGEVTEILADSVADLADCPLPVRAVPHPFDLYKVSSQWEKAQQRKIWLDCGGYLIIDPTEALTVIDVNSGKFTGKKTGAEGTFLHLNLEAAREIARLARLRSLGGIIIVDFVDMKTEESRQAVLKAMTQAVKNDPVKCVIHGFTHLGLLEMTRKKTENPQ